MHAPTPKSSFSDISQDEFPRKNIAPRSTGPAGKDTFFRDSFARKERFGLVVVVGARGVGFLWGGVFVWFWVGSWVFVVVVFSFFFFFFFFFFFSFF